MTECIVCANLFEESSMTTLSPSKYLGENFPEIASFCPACYHKFLVKTKSIYIDSENDRTDNLRDFTNT